MAVWTVRDRLLSEDTYDADSRLEVSRQVESREEPLVPTVGKVHFIQLQDGRRQLLKVVWKPVEQSFSQCNGPSSSSSCPAVLLP